MFIFDIGYSILFIIVMTDGKNELLQVLQALLQ